MDSQPPELPITEVFEEFIQATELKRVISTHQLILRYANLKPSAFNNFWPKYVSAFTKAPKSWKAKSLFSKLDKKASHKCYSKTKIPSRLSHNRSTFSKNNQDNSRESLGDSDGSFPTLNNNVLKSFRCLIVGGGISGLRLAIELQLLGSKQVTVVEKRNCFSRNNVIHLWPFVIDDLKSLGAKKFYGKFCAGSIDHISIRQLQLILLKISLMIGCDFRDSCSFISLCPSSIKLTKATEQLLTNGNESDIKKLDSDSSKGAIIKCDLHDVLQQKDEDNFVKVSNQNLNTESEGLSKSSINGHDTTYGQVENSFTTSDSMKVLEGSLLMDEVRFDHIDEIKEKSDDKNIVEQANDAEIANLFKEERHHNQADYLEGARAHFDCDSSKDQKELHDVKWDILVGADGRRNTLSTFFPRKEFRGKLAIAITANFINRQTPAEASISEISGLSYIYNQDMFNALAYDTNIELENICYYKDDTHYFVMTAKKKSLLERGVLVKDYATTQDLLSENNVDRQALLKYAKDAAYWTTGLEPLDFAQNHYGQEDCAMFDFTSMYAATNACKAIRTQEGGLTLACLVGDSLLEPFWPTGSGCARGFLSSFDAAWMCRQWSVNNCPFVDYHGTDNRNNRSELNRSLKPTTHNRMALSVIAERESIYRILAQTTSENLQQNYSHWTLNPHSRYRNLNRHLVLPSQVEHLMTDNTGQKISDTKKNLSPKVTRRVKSPYNGLHRRSPKKMKSTNTLPTKDYKNDSKTRLKMKSYTKRNHQEFRSKQELALDDVYYDLEASYNNLTDDNRSLSGNYLNYRRPNCDIYDDCFIPSISGTLPSSNNLLSLEARRARDIDECLRQRRQKNQLSVVRDQLVDKFKKNVTSSNGKSIDEPSCGAALFNELRKLKEQQVKDKENRNREAAGPLTLLNSMRRCASFAERVKSFESKLGQNEPQTTPTTPKVQHIDNVKNLPEFATLQELFVNNLVINNDKDVSRKLKMPIMKLSKDDWNVKCWEKRLASYRNRNLKEMCGSTKSLNRAFSVETDHPSHNYMKPDKQVEVFKGRIKEMADKLKSVKDKTVNDVQKSKSNPSTNRDNSRPRITTNGGWVSHLRKELTKGVEAKTPQQQAKNSAIPTKVIKKLFQNDDEDEDDGKHYDHLCVNRPTNKYLKNGYKSHLSRTKYNSATSKVINCEPTKESKLAYMNALTSRGSSASSEYSSATGGSTSGNGTDNSVTKQQCKIKCLRCDKFIDSADKITVDSVALHKVCLTCSSCGITLQTNEIQHYISVAKQLLELDGQTLVNFDCSICKPDLLKALNREVTDKKNGSQNEPDSEQFNREVGIRSREEFLNQKINYNELYKNILYDSADKNEAQADDLDTESNQSFGVRGLNATQRTPLEMVSNTTPQPGSSEKVEVEEDEDYSDAEDDKTSDSIASDSSSLKSPQNSNSTCKDSSTIEEYPPSDDEIVDNGIDSDVILNSLESNDDELHQLNVLDNVAESTSTK